MILRQQEISVSLDNLLTYKYIFPKELGLVHVHVTGNIIVYFPQNTPILMAYMYVSHIMLQSKECA